MGEVERKMEVNERRWQVVDPWWGPEPFSECLGDAFAFGGGGDVGPGISERMVAVARMMKTCRVSWDCFGQDLRWGKLRCVWSAWNSKVRKIRGWGEADGLRNDSGALGLKTAAVKCMICLEQGLTAMHRLPLESECAWCLWKNVAWMRMTLDCERDIPIAEGWWQRNVKIMLLKIERADCSECKAKRCP